MTGQLQLESFAEQALVTDVAVSPDGDTVAFTADEFDVQADERVSSLFVVPADGNRHAHRLTRVSSASQPAWSPDGSQLGFVAPRERDVARRLGPDADDDSDGDPAEQVWVFDLDRGGDPRQVTDFDEGVAEFDWGPGGDRLVAAARDPTEEQREYLEGRRTDDAPVVTERLQHKFDGEGWLDDVRTYLFVVDLASGETTRLGDAYGGGSREPATGLGPAWSPDGERIAFLSNRTARPDDSNAMDVYTICPDGDGLRRLTDGELQASELVWGPSGDRLAFVAGDAVNMYEPTQVYVYDRDDGEYLSVSSSLDRTVAWGGVPSWTGEESLVIPVGDEGRTRLVRLAAAEDAPVRTFAAQGSDRTVVAADATPDTVAVALSAPDRPSEVYAIPTGAVDGDGGSLRRLTGLNDAIASRDDAPACARVTFQSDGVEIDGLVYHPPDFDPDDPDERPVVTSIHGGPVHYDAPEYGFEYHYWTSRGYLVLRVNYRGSSSYGQSFSEVIGGEWGAREPDDVLAGVNALVDRGWADPERLFVTGFSYGGVTTGFLLTMTDAFAAAAAEHGIYDRRSCFGTADSHNKLEAEFGLPWENPERYAAISSIDDVGDVDVPLLLTAGGDDWRCPPSQSEQLYVSVKKQGVPARFVVYPDEHHNVGAPERAMHRIDELTGWFERFDPALDGGNAD